MLQTYIMKNMVLPEERYPVSAKQTDTAMTLMARDYKGWLNIGFNGIIEVIAVREREREMPDSERTRTTVKAKGMVTEGYPIIEKVTDEAAPILARDYKGAANIVYQNTVVECDRIDCLGQMDNSDGSYESANRVYGAEGIAPTIPTASGGGHIPKVMEVLPEERCVRKIPQEVIDKWTFEIDGQKYLIRVRKLTPRECLRLMDFDEDMIDRAVEVNSNSQLYKQAGNSICVGVLYHAYKQLFDLKEEKTEMIKPTDVNSEALAVYGIENQTRQFAEEFSELFVELNKVLRNRPDADLANVAEEIADVRIMLEQLTQYYNLDADVQIWLEAKYNRLARKLGFEEDITI